MGGGIEWTTLTAGSVHADHDSYPASASAWQASAESAVQTSTFRAWAICVPITAPGAPSVGAAAFDNGTATFSWTAPSNGGSPIQGYVITPYIGAVAQPEAIYNSTATTQTVFGLTNGTTYTFKVAAFNAIGTGPQSAATNAVTPGAVPSAPAIATAVSGNQQVTLSWTAPTLNAGRPLLGYIVTPYIGATPQTARTFPSTDTTQVITGLTNGTTYTFKVAGYNSLGTGASSTASAAVTPSGFLPFASWAAFINRQYLDLTTKAPTSTELSTWTVGLTAGSVTKGDLIESLRRGTDNTTNVDPTARLYRAFLGRAPDAGGLKFWIGRRRSGTWKLTRMADSFAASNEFKTKYGSLSNRAFVTRIYTDVLGRDADPTGVDYWTGKLDTKTRTRGQVMVGFSESSEYKRKQAENTDVAIAYIFLVGRAPTTGETTDWVTRQKAGTSQAALATELLSSSKYATHITG